MNLAELQDNNHHHHHHHREGYDREAAGAFRSFNSSSSSSGNNNTSTMMMFPSSSLDFRDDDSIPIAATGPAGAGGSGDDERLTPSSSSSLIILGPDNCAIHRADVLCGRGKTSFNHVGNKWFRDAVSSSMDNYMKADNRFEKSLVVHNIMDRVRKEGGRFLKKNHAAGNKWVELSEQQAKEKVGHAVRDAVNALEGRKKKGNNKRSGESIKSETDGDNTINTPQMTSVRSMQHVLSSMAAKSASSDQLPLQQSQQNSSHPLAFSFIDSSLLPQMQSISLRNSQPSPFELQGFDAADVANFTAQIGHASWSGNASAPVAMPIPLSRRKSLPLDAFTHPPHHHQQQHQRQPYYDFFQTEQLDRRRSLDPSMGMEEQQQDPQDDSGRPSSSPYQPQHHTPHLHSSHSIRSTIPPTLSSSSSSAAAVSHPPLRLQSRTLTLDQDDNFLEKIDSVLGPISSADLQDSLAPFFDTAPAVAMDNEHPHFPSATEPM